jgi:hypothetical protein
MCLVILDNPETSLFLASAQWHCYEVGFSFGDAFFHVIN